MFTETWIVVANSSQARIFHLETVNQMIEINTLEHPESRMHTRDLVSDRSGNNKESSGEKKYPIEPQNTPKKHEMKEFARELAQYLEHERNQNSFKRIYLAASPQFLGLLRQEMSNSLTNMIECEIDKDITLKKPGEIIEFFPIGV